MGPEGAEKVQGLLRELPRCAQRSLRKCWSKEITGPFRLPKRDVLDSLQTLQTEGCTSSCRHSSLGVPERKLLHPEGCSCDGEQSLRISKPRTLPKLAAADLKPQLLEDDQVPSIPDLDVCSQFSCDQWHRSKTPPRWAKFAPPTRHSVEEPGPPPTIESRLCPIMPPMGLVQLDLSKATNWAPAIAVKGNANGNALPPHQKDNANLRRRLLLSYSRGPAHGSLPSAVSRRPVQEHPGTFRSNRSLNRCAILMPYTKDLLCNWSPAEVGKIDALVSELARRWERDGAYKGWLAQGSIESTESAIEGLEIPLPTFVDLGCGDGRVVLSVSRRFPGSHCIGVDLNCELVASANARAQREGIFERCEFKTLDLSLVDLTHASVVFMHLPKPAVRYVVESVLPRSGLKPGGVIFSADCCVPADVTSVKDSQIQACTSVGLSCYTWLGGKSAPKSGSKTPSDGRTPRKLARSTDEESLVD